METGSLMSVRPTIAMAMGSLMTLISQGFSAIRMESSISAAIRGLQRQLHVCEPSDCNNNDIQDSCEIEQDPSLDADGDGIDECQSDCPADLDGDGLGFTDLTILLSAWGQSCEGCSEDLDESTHLGHVHSGKSMRTCLTQKSGP